MLNCHKAQLNSLHKTFSPGTHATSIVNKAMCMLQKFIFDYVFKSFHDKTG